jgi:hypothetical protein
MHYRLGLYAFGILYVCSNCCYWFHTSAFLPGIVNLVISFTFW